MRPLRIGYISHQFPPEPGAGAARISELSRIWTGLGAEVTVITGMPNRPEGVVHPGYRGRLVTTETYHGVTVLRNWLFTSPKHGFARTIANNLTFSATTGLRALLQRRPFDVLIASSPPFFIHPAGEVTRLLRRTKLVLELRDLWPDYLLDMGVLRPGVASSALLGLERHLLRKADHAVVVTESFRRRVIAKGVRPEAASVIPNGVDMAQYYADPSAPPPLEALRRRSDDEFVVGYLGNFGAGQDLPHVLDAAARLGERPVRFVLAGGGTEQAKLDAHFRRLGLRNVEIHGPIPKDRTRDFYNACDLCLVPLAPVPIFSETVPSKLFEVMACERPLLAAVAGEAARIVEASGAGWVVSPGDPEALADAVLRARDTSAAERRERGRRGRAYVERNYDRVGLATEYLGILNRVAGRPSRPDAPSDATCPVTAA